MVSNKVERVVGGSLFYVYQSEDGQFLSRGKLEGNLRDVKRVFAGDDYVVGLEKDNSIKVVGKTRYVPIKIGRTQLGRYVDHPDVDFDVTCGSAHCMALFCTLFRTDTNI